MCLSVETRDAVHRKRRSVVGIVLSLAALVAAAPAQEAAARSAESAEPATVAVIGASVSAGFVDFITSGPAVERNRTISLAVACRAIWPDERAEVRDYSDTSLFLAPAEKAERAVARALRAEPDLVVATDFMFWFGYGRVRGKTASGDAESTARLELQQEAFELLDRFDCPIIVGDYPDMRGAHPKMLSARQIPRPAALQELNERLRRWADERPRVHVFDLSEWVRRVKAEEESVVYEGTRRPLPSELLLQTDRLHATRLGVVLLAHRLLPSVRAAVETPSPLRVDLPDLPALLDRLGADVDIPEPAKK